MEMQILQINGSPGQWERSLDGVPPGGDSDLVAGRLVKPGAPLITADNKDAGRFRHFTYSYVDNQPDIDYYEESIPVEELQDILNDVANAVLGIIARQPQGLNRLQDAGASLTTALLPHAVIERLFELHEATPLVVRVDDIAACVPWELCYSPQHRTFLGTHLAISRGVAVPASRSRQRANPIDQNEPIVLSNLECIANPEGAPELNSCCEALQNQIFQLQTRGVRGHLNLQTQVKKREFLSAVGRDCFHYTGHIRFDHTNGSHICCSQNTKVYASDLDNVLLRGTTPRLAILNGCNSDLQKPGESGPDRSATQSSFVQSVYRSGALAVIGTRWEVDVDTAKKLDQYVYEGIANHATPIGELMRQFRRSEATGWPCYVLYGDPRLRFAFASVNYVAPRKHAATVHVASGDTLDNNTNPEVDLMLTRSIRRPTVDTPLYIAILLDNSGNFRKDATTFTAMQSFLSTLTDAIHSANAKRSPHGPPHACQVSLRAYNSPIRNLTQAFDQPPHPQQWLSSLATESPRHSGRYELGRVLKKTHKDLERKILQSAEKTLPAPIVVICDANSANTPSRQSLDAIRICTEIRNVTLPAVPPPNGIPETAVKTVAVGFGPACLPQLMRALANDGVDGISRHFLDADEAALFAMQLFDCLLEPQCSEPLQDLAEESDFPEAS